MNSPAAMKVLVLNAGSSSLKSSLFNVSPALPPPGSLPLWQAQIDWAPAGAQVRIVGKDKTVSYALAKDGSNVEFTRALELLFASLWKGDTAVIAGAEEVAAIGHRIVHGGAKYTKTTKISKNMLADLKALVELAPAHEPAGIKGIEAAGKIFPAAQQIAVFDTAFHATMPEPAIIYSVPYHWYEKLKIRRFGFHGISHQYCASRAAELLDKPVATLRIITCHLGGGASLCAVKDGKSRMTTMGFTPLEGLVMGTRCGSIDPGIILHLLKNKIYTSAEIETLLNQQSGLKGLSGLTSDMREIERLMAGGNERARLAFDVFINRLTANIAGLMPASGGLDVLAFTGGIGQNSSAVRAAACRQLSFMGVDLNEQKNQQCKDDTDISADGAAVKTLVIHAREDLSIARECLHILSGSTGNRQ